MDEDTRESEDEEEDDQVDELLKTAKKAWLPDGYSQIFRF